MHRWGWVSKIIKRPVKKWVHSLLLVSLLSGLLPASTMLAVDANDKMQPVLRQLVSEEPELMVDLIVQHSANSANLAALIAKLGGKITRELSLIQALAITLPISQAATLARQPDVRWISLDSQLYKSSIAESEGSVILREEFNNEVVSPAATGWQGLGAWSGQAWQEIGETDGATSGDVAVTRFFGGALEGLRLQNSARGLIGLATLGETTSSSLSYAYRRKDFDDSSDYVTIEVSTDEGASWTEVDRQSGPATDDKIEFVQIDLASYLVNTTDATGQLAIRFLISATFDTTDKFYIDFVQVEYIPVPEQMQEEVILGNHLFLPLMSQGVATESTASLVEQSVEPPVEPMLIAANSETIKNVADLFNTTTFNGNDGAENWTSGWVEVDPASGGTAATTGRVQLINSTLRLDNYGNNSPKPSAARQANLGNVSAATLQFGFYTTSGVDASDSVIVEVSKDGGSAYTVLETFTGITGAQYLLRSYNIARFASSNFRVRLRISAGYDGTDEYAKLEFAEIFYERMDSGAAWTTLIPPYNKSWSYLDNGSNQGTAWRQPGFDTSGWKMGYAELGYGDNDELGLISYGADPNNRPITTYFRRSFQVADVSSITQVKVGIVRDDGAVVYINGTEAIRDNMPAGPINDQTRASSDISLRSNETTFLWYTIPHNLLVAGENVIAVEIHQSSPSSNDLSFNLELDAYSNCVDCINSAALNGAYAQSIRATNLWNATPHIQGQGITIAVVDSGIAPHYDNQNGLLSDRVLKHVNFVSTASSPDDTNGHGSHIAGTIAGNGAKSAGSYVGIAPNANLVDVRVTNDQGSGTMSDVVAGLQWVYENKNAYNIRVANLSLNSTMPESYHTSPLNAAVEILWFNGVTVVVSSGNNGSTASGVLYPPANDPFVITVGAADDRGTVAITDDLIPSFSAYGTTTEGFAKPDLVAPGRNIISLLASDDSNLAVDHPANTVLGQLGANYFRMSGTSMASAVAAGAVALLLQDEPNLTPDQIKYRLKATANKNWSGYDAQKTGAGYLDIYAAVYGTTTLSANTGIAASQLLWSGTQPLTWGSVSWNSVSWNTVSWNTVSWNTVSWNTVSWNSVTWE